MTYLSSFESHASTRPNTKRQSPMPSQNCASAEKTNFIVFPKTQLCCPPVENADASSVTVPAKAGRGVSTNDVRVGTRVSVPYFHTVFGTVVAIKGEDCVVRLDLTAVQLREFGLNGSASMTTAIAGVRVAPLPVSPPVITRASLGSQTPVTGNFDASGISLVKKHARVYVPGAYLRLRDIQKVNRGRCYLAEVNPFSGKNLPGEWVNCSSVYVI
jgi:hypothetical protein